MKEVTLYTDGACSGNPGPGGYGAVLIYKDTVKELSEGFKETTNNRMELLSVVVGLRCLKEKCKVDIYSDSKYVVDAINKGWLKSWQDNNWRKSDKKEVKNVELWQELLVEMDKHEITFHWVKGHDGNEYNEICDKLAVKAYQKYL
ncbi:MAG: ribonuclease HI [archaeon]|nr:ribonuclease HI [archaeon]